jgi:hypothetical protein
MIPDSEFRISNSGFRIPYFLFVIFPQPSDIKPQPYINHQPSNLNHQKSLSLPPLNNQAWKR